MNLKLKIPLWAVLVFICIGFIGCVSNRKANPPQGEPIQKENSDEKVLLDAPIISQKPELKNGCEVTSLAMLLQYTGINVDKITLAQEIKKDKTPLELDKEGNIKTWGNPNDGFVGDITGENKGFAVYPNPMIELMEQYMPERVVNLTNQPFDILIKSIDLKKPVIAWITVDFKLPDKYQEWKKNDQKIKASLDEHAVLLTGYDKNNCYINNPYNGLKNQQVNKDTFKSIWSAMGSMAISYK